MSAPDTRSSDSRDLVDVLLDDVVHAVGRLKHGPDESSRRDAIRCVFAAIEGLQWELQRKLLVAAEHVLSEAERAFLRDVAFSVTENGQLRESRARLTLKQRARFTANLVTRLHPACSVDFQSQEWARLLASLDVRDRLTHPKNRLELDVTQAELTAALDGLLWYLGSVSNKIIDGLYEYRQTDEGRRGGLIRALMKYTDGRTLRLPDGGPGESLS